MLFRKRNSLIKHLRITSNRQIGMSVACFNRAKVALKHRPPLVEYHKVAAILLDGRHLMASHHDCALIGNQLGYNAFKHISVNRIEGAERFVEKNQFRIMD